MTHSYLYCSPEAAIHSKYSLVVWPNKYKWVYV